MAKRNMPSKEEMLARVRKKMQARSQGRRDPDEFRCPTAKDKQTLEYYLRILPELHKGDKCSKGESPIEQDLWYYENGAHFYNRNRTECPRCHDRKECEVCQLGFDLMQEKPNDKKYKQRIARTYLGRSYFSVNIYFLNHKKNPEELRGKVKWYNAPRSIWDIWDACINNDDAGDKDEPRACGLFYHPWDGGYTFKLEATLKGEYNQYGASKFLPSTCSPLIRLANGDPDDEAIDEILDRRHCLPEKFDERDNKKITNLVNIMLSKEGGGNDSEIISTKDDSSKDEKIEENVEEVTKAAPASEDTEEAPREKVKSSDEDIEEAPREKVKSSDEDIEEAPRTKTKKTKTKAKDKEPEPSSVGAPSDTNEAELAALLGQIED